MKKSKLFTEEDFFEPLSDMSMGTLGIFAIILLLMLVIRPQNHYEKKELHQKLKQTKLEIKELESKFQNKSTTQLEKSKVFNKIMSQQEYRDKWKNILALSHDIQKIKEIELSDLKQYDHSGLAHLNYTATKDKSFSRDQYFFYLNDQLKLKPKEFREIITSLKEPDEDEPGSLTFVIRSEQETQRWVKKQIEDWGWNFIEVDRK